MHKSIFLSPTRKGDVMCVRIRLDVKKKKKRKQQRGRKKLFHCISWKVNSMTVWSVPLQYLCPTNERSCSAFDSHGLVRVNDPRKRKMAAAKHWFNITSTKAASISESSEIISNTPACVRVCILHPAPYIMYGIVWDTVKPIRNWLKNGCTWKPSLWGNCELAGFTFWESAQLLTCR